MNSGISDTAANDAHMAAQQLIMLMSSGKEGDTSTLKQLQMFLQSAANATPSVVGNPSASGIGTSARSQPPPLPQQLQPDKPVSLSTSVAATTPIQVAHPHLSLQSTASEAVSQTLHTFTLLPGAEVCSSYLN